MNYLEKQNLFESFLNKWDHKFKNIPFIIKYISSYPELVSKLKDFVPLQPEEISKSQLEWVSLIVQFDHPLDHDFFKPYWVPIQNDGYDYFIDLSSETLALFEIQYFCMEPFKWHKKYHFKDIAELLISVDDSSIDIQHHQQMNKLEMVAEREQFFIERDLLGFNGKIEPIEIDKNFAISNLEETSCTLTEHSVVFQGICPTLIGLLPGDTEITLHQFESDYNRIPDFKTMVKNISALIYLLQSIGKYGIYSYQFSFNSVKNSLAEYQSNILTVSHSDQLLINTLMEKYELCKNS